MLRFPVWMMFWFGASAMAGFAESPAAPAPLASPWPAVDSDLAPASDLHEGRLANGLRYLILQNSEPKNHVSLRLLVGVGSLHENDDEQGLAHFVEHMTIRGTRSHPRGSLIPALERLGVAFGPDSNAFTFFDHTTYQLDLGDAAEETVRAGLRIFGEFAGEVTFDEDLINLERGVILSELETRNTPGARSARVNLGFVWPTARQLTRFPGGQAADVREFTRAQFVAFYDAWYRPDRMVVVVVGNIKAPVAERLITAEFGALAARGPARPPPGAFVPAEAANKDVAIYSDPGIPGCQFVLEHPIARPAGKDTHDGRVRDLYLSLAGAMFQRRLNKLSLDANTTFSSPVYTMTEEIPGWRLVTVGATGKIDDWKKVAADLEQEHRRAFLYGFSPAELEEARLAYAALYERATQTASTWGSAWLADRLVECVSAGHVFVRPAVAQSDLAAALAAATPADCLREFRVAWTAQAPLVYVSAHPQFKIARDQIVEVLNQSRAKDVSVRADSAASVKFPYTDFGAPGVLTGEEHVEDLDLWLAQFGNGVRCNFKATPFDADTVLVNVRIGEGKLSQPEGSPGLDVYATSMFMAGGLNKLSVPALGDMLAVSTVRPNFGIEPDAFVFRATCSRRDLLFCLQLVAAYLSDPAFGSEGARAAQAKFGSMYAALAASASGPLAIYPWRDLASGDRRFGTPLPEEMNQRTIAEMKAWLGPQLKKGAIEISVVGDTTWAEASSAVGRTLGALETRSPRRSFPMTSGLRPPHAPVNPKPLGIPPQLQLCSIAWYFPVPPIENVEQDRRYRLLAEILTDRLRVRLREELGATYTPFASYTTHNGFPAMNWFMCGAEIEAKKAQRVMQLIERETASLELEGPGTAEFEQAKQVFLRSGTDDLRTNAYWGLTVLSDVQEHPANLAAVRNRSQDCAAITRQEIAALTHCLSESNSFRYICTPITGVATQSSTPGPAANISPRPGPAPAGDAQPIPLFQTRPYYPKELESERIRGEVLVDFIVDTNGTVQNASAVRQSDKRFVSSAVAAVLNWKFRPGLKNGVAVRTHLQVPIIFEPPRLTSAASSSTPAAPWRAQDLDRIPTILLHDPPAYTEEMRRNRIHGVVLVEFVVDAAGAVVSPHANGSEDPVLARAAEETVAKWSYEPGEKNGLRVACTMRVPVVFNPPDQ